jgi:N-acetylmuramic acid 6-phosphate etherase
VTKEPTDHDANPDAASPDTPRPGTSEKSRQWHRLPTEARHAESHDLDTLSSERIVSLLLEEDGRGIASALHQSQSIAIAADWVAESLSSGGALVFAGAGTSGRLGILEAAECPPTFGTDPEMVRAVIAGGEEAVFRAAEGAEDRADDGRAAVENLGSGDILIGLSASSVTPYALGALLRARERGARTILLTCASPENLEDTADLVIALDSGPEILTGSTRLKAGSATKAALNAITTTAMVRLGKTYGNLMVDLRKGSAKLRDRAIRIVQMAGEVSASEALDLYEASGREVKTAIVMARLDLSPETARERLTASNGHVRRVLETFSAKP